MKTVFAALTGALGTTIACWRLIVLLWLVNVAAGWVIAAPLAAGIDRAFLHNPLAGELLTSFDNESYVDFQHAESEAVAATAEAARTAALPWLLLWTVLTAGVWSRVADRRSHPGFLAACGRYSHRFTWLLLCTLAALWGLRFVNDWLSTATTGWLVDDAHDSGAAFLGWVMHAKTLLMLGLVGVVVTAGRFARLRMIHLGERIAPRSFLRALFSVLRHLPSIGLGRILSLWPLVVVFVLYDLASGALLVDDTLLPGLRTSWRMLLAFQVTQLLLQAAFVYRMAVDARLWPIVAPALPGARPVAAPSGEQPAAPPSRDRGDDQPRADDDAEPTADSRPGAARPSSAARPLVTSSWLMAMLLVGASSRATAQVGTEAPAQQAPPPQAAQPQAPAAPPAAPAAAAALSERRNHYVMDVTLDLLAHTATGRQTATFLNTTKQPVGELWLHLYPNAFAHTRTRWIDAGGPDDILERGAEDGGYLDVRSVRLAGGADLADRTTIDETLLHVALEQPVPPGGQVALEIEFVTRFPRTIARMGMTGLHLNGMQWYPKFCAHDEQQGWSKDPFWRMGEFFADFGSYQVTFRYPASIDGRPVELDATGVPDEARPAADQQLVRTWRAEDVHDFAFCADPAFVRFVDEWTDSSSGRTVELVYLCQPYAEPKAQYVLDVVKGCLTHAARWWMPYPYPRLVIDGQPSSLGGGMEYPMLFTISQRSPLHLDWLNALVEDPASVTAHEFGHQYWYGILASDEVDEAWLDEGLNTYTTEKLLAAHFGEGGRTDALTFLERSIVRDVLDGAHGGRLPWLGDVLSLQQLVGWRTSPFLAAPPEKPGQPSLLGWPVPHLSELRLPDMGSNRMAWLKGRYAGAARELPLATPSREFDRSNYAALVYHKTALVLQTLENHVGAETMERLMRTYVERFRFRHPRQDDFLAVVSEVTGGAHDALLAALIETGGTIDWAVEDVTCRRAGALTGYAPQTRPGEPVTWVAPPTRPERVAPGFLERLWSALFTTPLPGAATPVAADGDGNDEDGFPADPDGWLTRYTVRQLGQIEAPVVVEARFADGSVQRETWDGRGSWRRFEHRTASKLVEIRVDPERRFAIDLDVNNNGHRIQPALETTRTLGTLAHFWAQNHLNAWSLAF